jgi:hypothetical protein
MFKIRGVDGKDYGPVGADVVREWIQQRRANAQTLVQAGGAADWKPLGALPEFAGALAAAAPLPGAGAAPVPPSVPPPKTSVLAIVALVLGILGLCSGGLLSLVGLPLGIVALVQIGKSQGRLGGKALALAAVCVSGALLVLLPITLGLTLPALAKAKSKAQAIQCVNNAKQIGLAVRIYTSDHDDKYPPPATWCDTLLSSGVLPQPQVFQCPAHGQSPCGYAFNARLAGKEEGKVDSSTVLIFESDAGWNASGGPELMIPKPRHGGVFVVGLADGSVLQVRPENAASLRWEP